MSEEDIERWGRLFPVSAKNLKNRIEFSENEVDLEVHRRKIEEWRIKNREERRKVLGSILGRTV